MDTREVVTDLMADFIIATDQAIDNEEDWVELTHALKRVTKVADTMINVIKESSALSS